MELRTLRLELPCLPPSEYSANRSRGADWERQYRISHGKRGAVDEIMALVREQSWEGPPLERAHINVTFYLPDRRRRDPESLIARCKPWLDGLVAAGVISDDSLDVIGWPSYAHEYRKGEPGTILEIKDRRGRPGTLVVVRQEA